MAKKTTKKTIYENGKNIAQNNLKTCTNNPQLCAENISYNACATLYDSEPKKREVCQCAVEKTINPKAIPYRNCQKIEKYISKQDELKNKGSK